MDAADAMDTSTVVIANDTTSNFVTEPDSAARQCEQYWDATAQHVLAYLGISRDVFLAIGIIFLIAVVIGLLFIVWSVYVYCRERRFRRRCCSIEEVPPSPPPHLAITANSFINRFDKKYGDQTPPSRDDNGHNTKIPMTFDKAPLSELSEADKQYLVVNMEDNEGVGELRGRSSSASARRNLDNPLGQLKFGLEYDVQHSTLMVSIREAANLPALDQCGTSDPYVKVYLLPDNTKYETKVQMKTLNPIFDETFRFTFLQETTDEKTLVMVVYDFNRFSKDVPIGEVRLRLDSKHIGYVFDGWNDLQPLEQDGVVKGEQLGNLCCSLCYVPPTGMLTVNVTEARDLKKMDLMGLSDPYVKITLMCNGKLLKKAKTTKKMHTLNPSFKESFAFDLEPFEQIQHSLLILTVMDHNRLSSSDRIGRVVLSASAAGTELEHWTTMLEKPRETIERWHALKPCW
ncbi:synaptotagmin-2-like [Paramacrobiotus metropolitanus]|uniref:synaptotagmin-2-like n=1 Tax=Paramacrobiotus metropolitanus TaxID=2943436 RepID=UPI00244638B2|nr:synaptotagmin-2-like [Paramacrobiotus metropolitanus]